MPVTLQYHAAAAECGFFRGLMEGLYMYWFFMALICALFAASQAAVAKKLTRSSDFMFAVWATMLFSLPFYAVYLFLSDARLPDLSPSFFVYLLCGTSLNVMANSLYYKSLSIGEISRDLPLLSLSPVFMMLTSYVMLGQGLDLSGAAAIVIMFFGAFVLQKQRGVRLCDTISSLFSEKGSRLMLLVAFLWSVTANFDKLCINEIGGQWYPAAFSLTSAVLFIPVLLRRRISMVGEFRRNWKYLWILGLFLAMTILPQMLAVASAPHVAYVITIKRGGYLLFGILFGALFFGEKNIGWRIVGGLWIMLGLSLLLYNAVNQ